MRVLRIIFAISIGVCALSATPFHDSWAANKEQALEEMKNRIAAENEEKQKLEEKAQKITSELNMTKKEMSDLALNIQNLERRQSEVEKRISGLELKKSVLDDQFNKDKASIARLILALERIRRMPPEAMLARPDAPYKTAQSAMLMGDIIPSINRHAANLKNNLETLNQVTIDLDQEQKMLQDQANAMQLQHEKLKKLIDRRQTLQAKANSDVQSQEAKIQKISLEARDLEELVLRLKENERKENERTQNAALRIKPRFDQGNMIDMGSPRLPISGIVRTEYGQKDDVDAKSNGLTIEGRKGAVVVAPMGGKIQFTGAFKRYGNIVIIEHKEGYHSLVAGIDKISSKVGDLVKSGEPIGFLPDSSLIPRPTLYYELRLSGTPVNPSVKFPDLG